MNSARGEWTEIAFSNGGTYTVQVERVGCAGGVSGNHGERDLDRRVRRQRVVAAGREEIGRGGGAGENLQKGGDGGRDESNIVDEELGAVL